jgi:phage terminase large subunit-like protein
VFLPEEATWLPDPEAELFAFPGSRRDDRCDSISQALIDMNVPFPMRISDEVVASFSRPCPQSAFYGRSFP